MAANADLSAFEKMGYESADAYYGSFAKRAEEVTRKMSGFTIFENGLLQSTGAVSQPYIRPSVRGKAAAPVEFGAKLDLSIDEKGLARLERLFFDAYNESDVLIEAIERYKERTGHYPERALADKIYRNRDNLAYCGFHGIRLSGSSLGRPKKNIAADKKTEYADNADRIEVERSQDS